MKCTGCLIRTDVLKLKHDNSADAGDIILNGTAVENVSVRSPTGRTSDVRPAEGLQLIFGGPSINPAPGLAGGGKRAAAPASYRQITSKLERIDCHVGGLGAASCNDKHQ